MQTAIERNPRPEKVAEVDRLTTKFAEAKSVFFTDYSGLTVADVSDLRRQFRQNNVEYLVVKNSLARLGAIKAGHDGVVEHLKGPIALAIGYEDPAAPARVIANFLKKHEKPAVKACLIDGDILDGSEAAEIAKWPTREELLAKLVGSLNSPITGLVYALSGVLRQLVTVLDAIRKQKEASN